MSWSELGGWSELEQGEQAGASWEQGEPAGGFLRPMVVGTLKPSITFILLPSLQLAPSSLPGVSHLVKLSLPDIYFICRHK